MQIHIGTSGYLYRHWNNGVFYPRSYVFFNNGIHGYAPHNAMRMIELLAQDALPPGQAG